jgi:hypothetical protein
MRAWYDVRHDRGERREDEAGVRASQRQIEALIERESLESEELNRLFAGEPLAVAPEAPATPEPQAEPASPDVRARPEGPLPQLRPKPEASA